MLNLKPCPFCGNNAFVSKSENKSDEFPLRLTVFANYCIQCVQCGAATKSNSSIEMCASQWNKRTEVEYKYEYIETQSQYENALEEMWNCLINNEYSKKWQNVEELDNHVNILTALIDDYERRVHNPDMSSLISILNLKIEQTGYPTMISMLKNLVDSQNQVIQTLLSGIPKQLNRNIEEDNLPF